MLGAEATGLMYKIGNSSPKRGMMCTNAQKFTDYA
jgi:hypothetical protein